MKIGATNYIIEPRVFLCGKNSEITVTPLGKEAEFEDGTEYTVEFVPIEEDENSWGIDDPKYEKISVIADGGRLAFSHVFETEQEWSLIFRRAGESGRSKLFASVYSLEKDLYVKNPYRGDCHSHSCGSDGLDTPALVAANYRRAGYDFLALTDHSLYWPSDSMIKQYDGVLTDIRLFHGEEIHFRGSRIHIVNFGGSESVNSMIVGKEKELEELFDSEGEKLKPTLPKGTDPKEYAARKWIYGKIHECGGLAIFAHPCWKMGNYQYQYNVTHSMTEAVIKTGIFDAMEAVTGQSAAENDVQQYLYHDLREKGYKIPIVGDSDSHGTVGYDNYFGWAQTLVFADSCEYGDICDAIRSLNSVAVEFDRTSGAVRVHGPLRLVRYSNFLIKNYYPGHNDLCFEEGVQMKNYLAGDPDSPDALARMSGRTAKYTARFFGREA